MGKLIHILSRIDGVRTRYDNQYLVSYDPDAHVAGEYDGGRLETTPDRHLACEFHDFTAAVAVYHASPSCLCHHLRPDGRENRPLTAYSVCIETAPAREHSAAGG